MSAKHLEHTVTLTIEAADIFYMREFLYEERISAEVDFDDADNLHNDRARRAAKTTLSREHARMTRVIEALDAADVREDLAKKIESMADVKASDEVVAATEDES